MLNHQEIHIRGAGEIASATACVLHNCGFRVSLSELPRPLAIRRTVTFSDVQFDESTVVEGITGRKTEISNMQAIFDAGEVPIITATDIENLPDNTTIIVDARLLKRTIDRQSADQPFYLGLGPGFTAGKNCHVAIETKRGHGLGRIITEGGPAPDTGLPGELGGETYKRLITAPADGAVEWRLDFGNLVTEGELLGLVDGVRPIKSPLDGIIRGLINPATPVQQKMKIGDVDPRGKSIDVNLISDKARSIGRGVLEAIMQFRIK